MIHALLPRFVLVVVAAPLAFLGALFAAARFLEAGALASRGPPQVAAVAAAVTFAAVALAPSHRNAAVRAGVALAAVAVAMVAALAR